MFKSLPKLFLGRWHYSGFARYLLRKFPAGLAYEDAVCLCQWLCTIRLGVPEEIRLTKFGELADAFVELSKSGWIHYQQNSDKITGAHPVISRDHWLGVTVRRFKEPDKIALSRGEELAKVLGFA